MRQLLRVTIETNGMRYSEAITAREAISKAQSELPNVVIADLSLASYGGIETVREVRRWSSIPMLVLSSRANEPDKVAALLAGADDYVAKPFATRDLVTKLRAFHQQAVQGEAEGRALFAVHDLRVDLLQEKVTVRGSDLHLAPLEYQLLALMIKKAGRIVTCEELLTHASARTELDLHELRAAMSALRRKLEVNPARPEYVRSEIGVGYRLAKE